MIGMDTVKTVKADSYTLYDTHIVMEGKAE